MRLRTFHSAPVDKINVTPLIDVVMVLIVFYLIVGKLATDTSARVDLPSALQGSQQQDRGLVINLALAEDGSKILTLDGEELAVERLASELILRMPDLINGTQTQPVSLRADKRLAYGDVQPIVDACKQAGVSSLKLITTRDSLGGASGGGR
ncbi:MAG TPA: biopolymer transporter ExbD [Phycisphaerales bacterium]|nr:biopolymer transporter ExbD [Phycisphaerales bacterium]